MWRGILVINTRDQTLYLPIFHDDRDFAYCVLTETMERWKPRETQSPFNDGVDFYEIADAIGREKSKSHIFIGPESIPYETPDSIISHASYVFAVNFEDRKIVIMK
jgi:hypothetical protein